MLDFGAAVARGQVAQQRDLALGPRREVGVARLRTATARSGRRRCAAAPARGRCRRRSARCCRRAAPRLPAARATSDSRSTGTAYAIAWRSFSSATRANAERRRHAPASTRHGTLVSSAVSPITGPATPKQAVSIGAVRARAGRVSSQERRDHRRQIGIVERGERAHRRSAAAAPARLEQAEQRLGSADVAGEEHALII